MAQAQVAGNESSLQCQSRETVEKVSLMHSPCICDLILDWGLGVQASHGLAASH